MERHDLAPNDLHSLFVEILLDEAVKAFKLQSLYHEIDRALEQRDKVAFLRLSSEWKELLES